MKTYDEKIEAAKNPNTPVDALYELSMDSELVVRQAVAEHPSATVDVLVELSKDSFCAVQQTAENSLKTINTNKKMEKIVGSYSKDEIQAAMSCMNLSTPLEEISNLSNGLFDIIVMNDNIDKQVKDTYVSIYTVLEFHMELLRISFKKSSNETNNWSIEK